jgi:hypothetical protein
MGGMGETACFARHTSLYMNPLPLSLGQPSSSSSLDPLSRILLASSHSHPFFACILIHSLVAVVTQPSFCLPPGVGLYAEDQGLV